MGHVRATFSSTWKRRMPTKTSPHAASLEELAQELGGFDPFRRVQVFSSYLTSDDLQLVYK